LLILALDTTARAGSIAVVRDDTVLTEITGDSTLTHGQRLPGELQCALESAHAQVGDVDLLAVAVGPGSFTGLRVGIASMQGLAFARGLKIVPVSTLEALAHETARMTGEDRLIASWIDAQRGEVFAALYETNGASVLVSASSAIPADTLQSWRAALGARRVMFAGDGAVRYRDVIAATLGSRAEILEPVPALAVPVARLARLDPGRAVLPHAIVPIYIRRSDAELARERQPLRSLPTTHRE
jgi:tRNA threonylcarbamoyladenosine biosynthesis protein TsaB